MSALRWRSAVMRSRSLLARLRVRFGMCSALPGVGFSVTVGGAGGTGVVVSQFVKWIRLPGGAR